jgi:hypothetical protein
MSFFMFSLEELVPVCCKNGDFDPNQEKLRYLAI